MVEIDNNMPPCVDQFLHSRSIDIICLVCWSLILLIFISRQISVK